MTNQDNDKIQRIFMDLCHDRGFCRCLNVNYFNPSPRDYETLRECARTIYYTIHDEIEYKKN